MTPSDFFALFGLTPEDGRRWQGTADSTEYFYLVVWLVDRNERELKGQPTERKASDTSQ